MKFRHKFSSSHQTSLKGSKIHHNVCQVFRPDCFSLICLGDALLPCNQGKPLLQFDWRYMVDLEEGLQS